MNDYYKEQTLFILKTYSFAFKKIFLSKLLYKFLMNTNPL